MAKVTQHEDGNFSVNRIEAFTEALNGRSPFELDNYMAFIEEIEEGVRAEYPAVSRGALNNARGDWYESLIALGANEYSRREASPFALVRLPNVNVFDCERLYQVEISELIAGLRVSLREEADVSLISSNPDFVVVSTEVIELPDTLAGQPKDLDELNSLYAGLEGVCQFDQVSAYCSVKSGLRPDRRLQIAHEGSLMKALYRHVQTRLWAIDAPG